MPLALRNEFLEKGDIKEYRTLYRRDTESPYGRRSAETQDQESYYGRRSAQTTVTDYDYEDQEAVETTNPIQNKASASVIARILAAAGAKPTPVRIEN